MSRLPGESGRSGCQQTWLATPGSYQTRTARRPLSTHYDGAYAGPPAPAKLPANLPVIAPGQCPPGAAVC
jgi:hypothetical protein